VGKEEFIAVVVIGHGLAADFQENDKGVDMIAEMRREVNGQGNT